MLVLVNCWAYKPAICLNSVHYVLGTRVHFQACSWSKEIYVRLNFRWVLNNELLRLLCLPWFVCLQKGVRVKSREGRRGIDFVFIYCVGFGLTAELKPAICYYVLVTRVHVQACGLSKEIYVCLNFWRVLTFHDPGSAVTFWGCFLKVIRTSFHEVISWLWEAVTSHALNCS